MNSNTVKVVAAVVVSAALWLTGVLVFGGTIGMICVFLGIIIGGYTAGVIMDTPCTTSTLKR